LVLQVALVLGTVSAARGDVTLLPEGNRFMQTNAQADGIVDNKIAEPVPGAPSWNAALQSAVDGTLGDAQADAVVGSFASTDSLVGNGQATASRSGVGSSAFATSHVDFRFTVSGCENFGYFSGLGLADLDDVGSASFDFLMIDPGQGNSVTIAEQTLPGGAPTSFLSDFGQLSEGTYLVRGESRTGPVPLGSHSAPDYSWTFNFSDCLVALIDQQPVGGPIAQGATATLTVGAAAAAAAAASGPSPAGVGGLTYQWRRGNQDLVDNGHISGATTDTLTITNFGPADVGGYSVWVSDGFTRQLSSLAVLQLPPVVPALSPAGLLLAAGLILASAFAATRWRPGQGSSRRPRA
jgi:hypothetical protein